MNIQEENINVKPNIGVLLSKMWTFTLEIHINEDKY